MISRVQALYYKGLKYIDINLNPFVIMIGPNASGKSTFLDIFTFLRDLLNEGPVYAVKKRCYSFKELLWNQEGNKFEIAIELPIPEDKNEKYDLARYEIAISTDEKEGIIIENEKLLIRKKIKKLDEKIEEIISFPVEHKPPESIVHKKINGWRTTVSKVPKGKDYFSSETTGWKINYRFGPTKSSLARIVEDDRRFPITLWVRDFLMEGIQFLQLNSLAMRKPCPNEIPLSFQMDGSNLPNVIKNLKDKHKELFDRWVEHIKTAIEEIEDIGIEERPENRSLYIYIKHNNMKVPSWLLSDGTLRLLAQTLIPYLPVKDNIYLIEEPENGLHPLAIESAFQSLSSVYDSQVLLATHSPIVIGLSKLKNILCFSKTKSGAVDIIEGENHPRLKDWRGEVDLATFHAAGVLQ